MNLLHIKYAVEVAKLGSLSKASESLIIAQPNISRAIKDLEADLGITIFNRTAKGMVLTPEGEVFIGYAESILDRIDEVEAIYKQPAPRKQKFSVSSPRTDYISNAFAEFTKTLDKESVEIYYKETNSQQTINDVCNGDYRLGIIRCSEDYEESLKATLDEKGLSFEIISEFNYVLLMSKDNILAEREEIKSSDYASFVEIINADSYIPSLTVNKDNGENPEQRVNMFERASQLELLSENPKTVMLTAPMRDKTLERYNLVQKPICDNKKVYKDILIYRQKSKYSNFDKQFIKILKKQGFNL